MKTPIGLPKAGDIKDHPYLNFLQFVYNPTPKWIRARMKDPFQQNEAGLHLSALNAPNEKGPQLSVLTTPWEKGLGLSARIAQIAMEQNTPLQHQFETTG